MHFNRLNDLQANKNRKTCEHTTQPLKPLKSKIWRNLSMYIVIPGQPIAKQRHRSRCGRNKRSIWSYDPQHEKKLETRQFLADYVKNVIENNSEKDQMQDVYDICDADYFHVELIFYMQCRKDERSKTRVGWRLDEYIQVPDIDNLIKYIFDCANTVLWQDDSMVTKVTAIKKYSDNPRTILTIIPRKKMQLDETAEKILELVDIEEFIEVSDYFLEIQKYLQTRFDNPLEITQDQEKQRAQHLINIAKIISKVSNLSEKFTKISKKFPDYHKDVEKILFDMAKFKSKMQEIDI